MRGPNPKPLTLSEEEQTELERLVRRHGTPQQQALRGRMILAAANGKNNSQIGRRAERVRGDGASLARSLAGTPSHFALGSAGR